MSMDSEQLVVVFNFGIAVFWDVNEQQRSVITAHLEKGMLVPFKGK